MKLAAIADLHCTTRSSGKIRRMLAGAESADVLALGGDLTNVGQVEEMEVDLMSSPTCPCPRWR